MADVLPSRAKNLPINELRIESKSNWPICSHNCVVCDLKRENRSARELRKWKPKNAHNFIVIVVQTPKDIVPICSLSYREKSWTQTTLYQISFRLLDGFSVTRGTVPLKSPSHAQRTWAQCHQSSFTEHYTAPQSDSQYRYVFIFFVVEKDFQTNRCMKGTSHDLSRPRFQRNNKGFSKSPPPLKTHEFPLGRRRDRLHRCVMARKLANNSYRKLSIWTVERRI